MNVEGFNAHYSREQLYNHRISRLVGSNQLNIEQPLVSSNKQHGKARGHLSKVRGPIDNIQTTLGKNRVSIGNALRGPLRFFYLFMKTSSIHGFNHLTTRRRHILEHVLWLVAMCAGMYGFSHISYATLSRYKNNPTVVSLERNYMDWNTTLPAATVCPTRKYDPRGIDAVMRRLNISEEKSKEAREFLMKLAGLNYRTLDSLPDFPDIAASDYQQAVVDMRFNFECNTGSSFTDMRGQDLVLSLTEMGVCYSFNSRLAIFTDPQAWKSGNMSHPSTEYALEGSPLDGDIFVQLLSMQSDYYVYLHSPDDVPDITSRANYAYLSSYLTMNVHALSIVSTALVRDSLSIEQRKCRFPHESNLKISPKYSYNLCRMECRMMLASQHCGCVPYFYKPSADYKVCDVNGTKCLAEHSDLLIKLVHKDGQKIECNCLPTCDDVNYVIEFLEILDWNLGTNLRWGVVRYPRERFIRDVLFGVTEVLVALGGTAGFFFGCSVLSLVEIFYFFTLRLWWFAVKKI